MKLMMFGGALRVAAVTAALGVSTLVPTVTFADGDGDAVKKAVAPGVREDGVTGVAYLQQNDDTKGWTIHATLSNTTKARVRCAAAISVNRVDGALLGRVISDGTPVWGTTRTFDIAAGEEAEVTIPAPAEIVRQIERANKLRDELMARGVPNDPHASEEANMRAYVKYASTPIASYSAQVLRVMKL